MQHAMGPRCRGWTNATVVLRLLQVALPIVVLNGCSPTPERSPVVGVHWHLPDAQDQSVTMPVDATTQPSVVAMPPNNVDAHVDAQPPMPMPMPEPMPPQDLPPGLPTGAETIAGVDFFQRVVGTWSGLNSNTPLGFNFPMTVDIAPSGDAMLFGKFDIDAANNVLWGFNIEDYEGQPVLAYRNGGYLGGFLRDSRTKLVEHDPARGYYRFCAVLEGGVRIDNGCNYIDARYTFSASDHMLFQVFTRGTSPHVHWDATRIATHTLPDPFPATAAAQGNGSTPWPAAAGIP